MSVKKVLVAEDENEIRELIKLYLAVNNFDVYTAVDGIDAIEQFNKVQPDLVLLDVLMPKKNGLEVCQELRKSTDVPIIFLSCQMARGDVEKGYSAGANEYMTKPFDPTELIDVISSFL